MPNMDYHYNIIICELLIIETLVMTNQTNLEVNALQEDSRFKMSIWYFSASRI
jgi:hypothetical protein